jgi:hypothetical protein
MRLYFAKLQRLVAIVFLSLFTSLLLAVPASAVKPADNGDVKTHNVGTSTADQRDEPKVCTFYLDAFNFDAAQQVNWRIVQDTHGSTVLSGGLTLDQQGHGVTTNYGLSDGMYKLYWNFNGENGSAKHKVFKVSCQPVALTVVTPATPTHTTPTCGARAETVAPALATGIVWSPNGAVTVLQPGQSMTYTASPAQGYAFSNSAQTSWTVTNILGVTTCPATPTTPTPPAGRGGGQVLAASTTTPVASKSGELANTGTNSQAASLIAALLLASSLTVANIRPRKLNHADVCI